MSVHLENGRWYVRFQINGYRHRKVVKEARTKKQAERAEQVIRNEIFEKRWGETDQRNFADFVDKTYRPHAQQHKKGFHVERSVLTALVETFGKLRLAEVTAQGVLDFQQRRASETTTRKTLRSRATVNRDMAVLSAIFKLACRLGEVKENPVRKIQYFGNLPKRDRVLSDEEEIRLLDAIGDDLELRQQVEILLYSGLRRNELFLLQWQDVDGERGVLRLRAETTKTGKQRTTPLFSNVRAIFAELLDKAGTVAPNDLIFTGPNNTATTFSLKLKEVCARAGIENLTAHSLRHTFSTRANRFGVDAFAQKEALGHSKLSQTADYTHQSSETFLRNFDGFEIHLRQRNDRNNSLH